MNRMTTLPPRRTPSPTRDTPPPVVRATHLPVIRREGIDWTGGTRGHPLQTRLTFENPSARPTNAVDLWIGVADFGAFLPHRPVQRLRVPRLAPGERRLFTPVVAGVQADDLGRVTVESARRFRESQNLAAYMLSTQARGSEDPGALLERVRRMVGESMARDVMERVGEWKGERRGALAPRGALNVAITTPDGMVMGERHLLFSPMRGWVRPGEETPMPFSVAERGKGYELELAALSEGWHVRLEPGGFGTPVRGGRFQAWVIAPTDATEGELRIDVHCRTTGAVCPVEWRWESRTLEDTLPRR